MLFAKINPTAKTTKKINPFQSDIIESNYMTVMAINYICGAPVTNFKIVYGVIIEDCFYKQDESKIELSATDIQNWGVDDSSLLTIIATQIGTNIIEFYATDLGDDLLLN